MLGEVTLPAGNLKRIHVNGHRIKSNQRTGERNPVFTVKHAGTTHTGHAVVIRGDSWLVYAPDHPLSCGARAWVETRAEVEVRERCAGQDGQPASHRGLLPLPQETVS